MSRAPLNLDRLVRQLVLDLNLVKWFAEHDRRKEIVDAINLLRRGPREDGPALDAIQKFIERET